MKQCKAILVLGLFLFGILLVACSDSIYLGLQEIGNEEFAEIVTRDSETGYLVYIGRPTCQYCRVLKPILEGTLEYLEVSMYYFQTATARYADEDKMLELLDPLNIDGIPIIVRLVDGRVVDYLIGVHPQAEIIAFIEANNLN